MLRAEDVLRGKFARAVCMLGDFPAVAVRHDLAAEIAACGVFNVVADRQRELVGHEAFFKQIHCDGIRHLAHNRDALYHKSTDTAKPARS